jgi:hypothetical protein
LSGQKLQALSAGFPQPDTALPHAAYVQVDASDEVAIKETVMNVPLYYLLFASKHPKGMDFWKKISSKTPSGQTSFKFDG